MGWLARLRNVFRSNTLSDEIDRELAFHLEERVDELIATGMSPDEARHEARRRFGSVTLQAEETRERDLLPWLDTFRTDLRYAIRALRASPGFALVAILSLALGIGANTAIFTLINTAMLRSLPVSHPDELMWITRTDGGQGGGKSGGRGRDLTHPIWERLRDLTAHDQHDGHAEPDRGGLFAGLVAYASTGVDIGNAGGDARTAPLGLVSGGFFPTLGVRPALGRTLTPADDQAGCPGVAVISHDFWRSQFGGRDTVLGASLPIDGRPFQIVGVAEPAFFGLEFGYHISIWAPLCSEAILYGPASSGARSAMSRLVIGRLAPGATLERIGTRLAALAPVIAADTLSPDLAPDAAARHRSLSFSVTPFAKGLPALRARYGAALFVLMAAVGVVLLIACVNVANLLLTRATARQHEMAVRLAIGASRGRLIRQLLTESILLSLLGAAAGVLFAMWGSRALVGLLMATRQARAIDVPLDVRVLAFTIVVGVLTGVLFGLAPAWRAGRVDPHAAMKPRGRGVAEGQSRFSLGKALVVCQIALSLLAVVSAGLLVGSWRRLATLDPGFRSDHVLLVSANLRAARVPAQQRAALYQRMIDRLRAVPGVTNAGGAVRTPIGNVNWNAAIAVDGFTPPSDAAARVQLNEVSTGYFAAIGVSLLAGRDFASTDRGRKPEAVIVNEELARTFFGGVPAALGRSLRTQFGRNLSPPMEVVGVVASTKDRSLQEPSPPMLYVGLEQDPQPGPSFSFALRTSADPSSLGPSVNAALAEIEPRASLTLITFERQIAESLRLPRTLGMLSGFFGASALLLASIGLYGLMAFTVARRRNEIGVRLALGAARAQVVRMVLGDVTRLVVVGSTIGVALSLGLTQLMTVFLYDITPRDPATLALAALTLVIVSIAAAAIPARRAARLDPMTALRED